jgi:formylglycine-generating enzyme required for sulfatase activity
MVAVPAGPFLRGCDEGDRACQENSQPKRTITLSAFEFDRIEVSVGAYRECVDAGECDEPERKYLNPATPPPDNEYFHYDAPGREDTALNGVTWFQAETYCAWRGKRLPTSAEWEKAARGTDGRTFPWGEEAPNCTHGALEEVEGESCGFENAFSGVGTHPAGDSPFGAADTVGGVVEWVSDWFATDSYASDAEFDPQGPDLGMTRVNRGGGWKASLGDEVVVWLRRGSDPNLAISISGFRCARSVE